MNGGLKIGIIGAGQVARTSHIPAYMQLQDRGELVAVCDTDENRAGDFAREFRIPHYYGSLQEMLSCHDLDCVSVCVPNKFHKQAVVEALAAGCHVLCEKPPAIGAGEVEEMRKAALDSGKKLSFNFHWRQTGEFRAAKRFVEQGLLGTVYNVKVQALRRRGIPGWGSFTDKKIQGGGPLIDIGIHMLDAALSLIGFPEPEHVLACAYDHIGKRGGIGLMGAWSGERFSVEDSLFGMIRFKNGLSMMLETAFALNMEQKSMMNVQLFGDKAGISVFPTVLFGEEGDQLFDMKLPFVEQFDARAASIKAFALSCIEETPVAVTPDEAVRTQLIVDALYESAGTGKPVCLTDNSGK